MSAFSALPLDLLCHKVRGSLDAAMPWLFPNEPTARRRTVQRRVVKHQNNPVGRGVHIYTVTRLAARPCASLQEQHNAPLSIASQPSLMAARKLARLFFISTTTSGGAHSAVLTCFLASVQRRHGAPILPRPLVLFDCRSCSSLLCFGV